MSTMVEAVREAVAARAEGILECDRGAVELALKYAEQIDDGMSMGGQAATKGLHLGPHLLKVLSALGCTPEARGELLPEVKTPGESGPASAVSRLQEFRNANRRAAAS